MKEKIEIIDFKYKVTIFTFILFLIICALSPLSGDDWKSYIIGRDGLVECFNNITINDGRLVSGFLINFLSYNKILFDISFAILISKFVSMCNDLMGTVKNKYYFLYPLIGVLLVSAFMFSYNYVSVTSTVTYTFPAILTFYYFYLLLKHDELKIGSTLKLLLISIYISLSNVHLAVAFFIANLLYLVMNYKKKENRLHYIFLLITSFITMLVSLSFIETNIVYTSAKSIFDNIPCFIDNIFSKNIVLVILGAIPINYYLNEKLNGHTYGRVVITLFDLFLFFSLCYNFLYYSPVNLNLIISKYNGIFATENWYYIFYFIMYLVLFFLSMNYYIKNKRLKNTLNTYYYLSIVLMILLIVSPIFDKGNVIFIVFTILMITCINAEEIEVKVYEPLVKLSISLLVVYYLSMFGITKYIDYTRNDYIEEQLKAGSENIEVKANPIYLVWRYNPDYFQRNDFKKYYNIDKNQTIEVKYFGIFEKIEKKVK